MPVTKRILLFAIVIFIGFQIYYFSDFLDQGKRITLSIFGIATIFWVTEWIPLSITSILVLFLEVVLLGLPNRLVGLPIMEYDIFFTPFFSPIITLFLGSFAIGLALKRFKVDQFIAFYLIKKSNNHPLKLMVFLILFSAAASMWMSNTATSVLLIMTVLPIVKSLKKGNPLKKSLLLSIPIGATIGGISTPVGTPPNAIAVQIFHTYGVSVSFFQWITYVLPVTCIVLLFSGWILYMLFPSSEKKLSFEFEEKVTLQRSGIVVVLIFLFTVFLWLTSPIHLIPEGIVAFIPIILYFGLGFLKTEDIKDMGWDVLLLMGGGMSLGVAIQQTGLANYFIHVMLEGQSHTTFLVFILSLSTLILSTFINNTVASSLTIPLVIELGGHGEMIINTLMVTLSASMALSLPVSSLSNAMVFSTGYVRAIDMFKTGTFIAIVGFLVVFLTSRIYWTIL